MQCVMTVALAHAGYLCQLDVQAAAQNEYDLHDPQLRDLIAPDLLSQLHEDLELLEVRRHGGK